MGRIAFDSDDSTAPELPGALGEVHDLLEIVARHRIELLLLTHEALRTEIFDRLVRVYDRVQVRVVELSTFYEETFRQVALAEIDAAWLQHVVHPRFRPTRALTKRVFDIWFALVLVLLCAPLLVIAALLIRLDGGPVVFRQVRTGQNGRPFTLYKLRTMDARGGGEAVWSRENDPRVTPIGRILRRFHLDELAQLHNVLRGDMSIVGPRPEQPALVSRLERILPLFPTRHVSKPGVTGWAQVRAGYAASDCASAWKLSYDLYYLKHQSIAFDLRIITQTIWTVAFCNNYIQLPHAPLITQGVERFETSAESRDRLPAHPTEVSASEPAGMGQPSAAALLKAGEYPDTVQMAPAPTAQGAESPRGLRP